MNMNKTLPTKRQQEYIDVILGFIDRNGYCPTIRQIGRLVKVSSSATVFSMLVLLKERGLFDIEYYRKQDNS